MTIEDIQRLQRQDGDSGPRASHSRPPAAGTDAPAKTTALLVPRGTVRVFHCDSDDHDAVRHAVRLHAGRECALDFEAFTDRQLLFVPGHVVPFGGFATYRVEVTQ